MNSERQIAFIVVQQFKEGANSSQAKQRQISVMCVYFARSFKFIYRVRFYHLKIYDHRCDKCSLVTPNAGLLKRHIQNIHEKIKPFQCDKCSYSTSSKHHLKKHINSVHEGRYLFNCEKCVYKVNDKHKLRKHRKVAHNIEEDSEDNGNNDWKEYKKNVIKKHKFNCNFCTYKNDSRRYFLEHLRDIHHQNVHPQGNYNDSDFEELNEPLPS